MTMVTWKAKADEHDYPAASQYLSLLMSADEVKSIIASLEAAEVTQYKAKDVLRASRLPLLPVSDAEVIKDLEKIRAGEELSPILLVQGGNGMPLVVADGYHRVCASYWTDEDERIPAQIVAGDDKAAVGPATG